MMGLSLSQLFSGFFEVQPAKVVMLGLDAAGKTTILYKIKLNENVHKIPTIGFNVETVEVGKGVTFTVWDVGGQDKVRALWRHYIQKTDGLLFVVDSADRERMDEAREELFGLLDHPLMANVPVTIIANKQDLPGAMKPSDMIERLRLRELKSHKWHIQSASAAHGEGIHEAIHILSDFIKDFRRT